MYPSYVIFFSNRIVVSMKMVYANYNNKCFFFLNKVRRCIILVGFCRTLGRNGSMCMQSNFKPYEFQKNLDSHDNILNGSFTNQKIDSIPSRDMLCFNNGYYVNYCILTELDKILKRDI